MVAGRVEIEFVSDRLVGARLAQAYAIAVPDRRRVTGSERRDDERRDRRQDTHRQANLRAFNGPGPRIPWCGRADAVLRRLYGIVLGAVPGVGLVNILVLVGGDCPRSRRRGARRRVHRAGGRRVAGAGRRCRIGRPRVGDRGSSAFVRFFDNRQRQARIF